MRVEGMVRQVVSPCVEIMHAARFMALVKVVTGTIRAGRLSPAAVGRSLAGRALPKHAIKCVDRLLGNAHLTAEYRAILRVMTTRVVGACKQPIVLVDWTAITKTLPALVAAVPIGGRAVPIYFEVHPLKKLSNAQVERRFLQRLQEILPTGCRPVVVSDAGYKGPFFEAVRALGWDFVGRVRGTTTAILEGGAKVSKDQLYARASPAAKALGSALLFAKQKLPVRLVLVRKRRKPGPKRPPPLCKEERDFRKAALDPWLLATSLIDAEADHIVALYAKRMQIEETFRDAKNHRFGWSLRHVRTNSARRATLLLLIAVLALFVVTVVGLGAEHRGAHRAYQANTITHRRVLSLFALGAIILRRRDRKYMDSQAFLAALTHLQQLLTS